MVHLLHRLTQTHRPQAGSKTHQWGAWRTKGGTANSEMQLSPLPAKHIVRLNLCAACLPGLCSSVQCVICVCAVFE